MELGKEEWLEKLKDLLLKEDEVRLLICGSRDLTDPAPIYNILVPLLASLSIEVGSRLIIVEGGARGADKVAKDLALRLGLRCETYVADWDNLGRSAGYVRNADMVKVSSATLAYWDRISKGTKHSINLSIKKRIPLMIEDGKLDKLMSEGDVVNNLVKNHLMNNLTFAQSDLQESVSYLNEITKCDTSLVDLVAELDRTHEVKPEYLNSINLDYISSKLAVRGMEADKLTEVSSQLSKIKDIITPKVVNLIYLKLDTGGFPGYKHYIRSKGEDYYPVLRITMIINDAPPLDLIINPKETIEHIDKGALKIHEESGLLELAKSSKIDLETANAMVKKYIHDTGIKSTNPTDNIHTHLVGYNTDFLRTFMTAKFPNVLSICSPKDIDVFKLVGVMEITGKYDIIPVPQLYRHDPIKYLNVLKNTVDKIL
ncbi:hypothetical protein TSMG0093 [Halocynthia phage JM-2012]|uniref:hypothetical protein n=1 Tax=Halocynthia phage JM-2012 TaxID=1173297 RepID=UPI00025C6931|nr:hypothetical protein TSMG0093 [Halocynthia phage JM-2012]AFI55376.1 hypothetical protein TSMG0093 [Halocynthia phage JM-2012]